MIFNSKLKKWISVCKSKTKSSQSQSHTITSSSFSNYSSSTLVNVFPSAHPLDASSVGVVTTTPTKPIIAHANSYSIATSLVPTSSQHVPQQHTIATPHPLVVDSFSSRVLYPTHLIQNPVPMSQQWSGFCDPSMMGSYHPSLFHTTSLPATFCLAPSLTLTGFSLDRNAVLRAYRSQT